MPGSRSAEGELCRHLQTPEELLAAVARTGGLIGRILARCHLVKFARPRTLRGRLRQARAFVEQTADGHGQGILSLAAAPSLPSPPATRFLVRERSPVSAEYTRQAAKPKSLPLS